MIPLRAIPPEPSQPSDLNLAYEILRRYPPECWRHEVTFIAESGAPPRDVWDGCDRRGIADRRKP